MSCKKPFGYKAFEKWEVKMVNEKARRLIGKYGFTPSDEEDLRQKLLLHIFLKKKGGPTKVALRYSSPTAQILDNRIRDLIEQAQAKKREGDQKSDSLYMELGETDEGEPITHKDILGEDKSMSRTGKRRHAEENEIKLILSLAFDKLTPIQRRICRLLMKHKTLEEIAQILGIKRPTLYLEFQRIRVVFNKEGLGQYI